MHILPKLATKLGLFKRAGSEFTAVSVIKQHVEKTRPKQTPLKRFFSVRSQWAGCHFSRSLHFFATQAIILYQGFFFSSSSFCMMTWFLSYCFPDPQLLKLTRVSEWSRHCSKSVSLTSRYFESDVVNLCVVLQLVKIENLKNCWKFVSLFSTI